MGKFTPVVIVSVFVACGGGPTSPGPVPGGETRKPADVFTTPEMYLMGQGYMHTSSGVLVVPDGCLKTEVLRIDPGRDSIIQVGPNSVGVDLRHSVCAEAPVIPGRPLEPFHAFLDEGGNQSQWLTGGSGAVAPGQSREVQWRIVMTPGYAYPPPPFVASLKIVWAYGGGGFVSKKPDVIIDPNDPDRYVKVVIPIRWRYVP